MTRRHRSELEIESGVPLLAGFARVDQDKKVITTYATPFKEPFVIIDPYTEQWDLVKKSATANNIWLIPAHMVQYIHNHMRLVRFLWLPYTEEIAGSFRVHQAEFYLCETGNDNDNTPSVILLPLRIAHRRPDEDDAIMECVRLHGFAIPTFSFDSEVWTYLNTILPHNSQFHSFYFYDKHKHLTKPVSVIQFMFMFIL